MDKSPVYIFDLDETILSINSFPRWVMYLLRGRFGGLTPLQRVRLTLVTASVLGLRKLHMMPHVEAKHRFQRLWDAALGHDPQRLAETRLIDSLLCSVRPGMKEALAKVHTQNEVVLATAAAAEYALALGHSLGFRHVLATPSAAAGFGPENVRQQKCDTVLAFLQQQGWADRPRVFFTDHHEDVPLIKVSQTVFWFGEDSAVPALQAQAPGVQIHASLNRPAFADQL